VGRWWALLAALALAIWIGVGTDVNDVPPWFLALAYGVPSAAAIAAGVVLRQRRTR
jgi:ABC-type multidrug transport system permease subunit